MFGNLKHRILPFVAIYHFFVVFTRQKLFACAHFLYLALINGFVLGASGAYLIFMLSWMLDYYLFSANFERSVSFSHAK